MKNNGNMGKAGASFTIMGMKIPRKALIGMIVILVVLTALGAGGYLLYTNYNYYSTDDAQVTGNIVDIDAMVTGTLNSLAVNVGDFVSTDEVIGTVKIQGSYATRIADSPVLWGHRAGPWDGRSKRGFRNSHSPGGRSERVSRSPPTWMKVP